MEIAHSVFPISTVWRPLDYSMFRNSQQNRG